LAISFCIFVSTLQKEAKWTRFPARDIRQRTTRHPLSDLFTIKRGIATGDNDFFILTRDQIEARQLPFELFRPILPSPRYIPSYEINGDEKGIPVLDRQLFLLDCRLSEEEVRKRFPNLWAYLEGGKGTVSERYLCRSRRVWYFQEERRPAPILCTYLGRSDTKTGRPFRFILNHSKATAANVYLLLYPKAVLASAILRDSGLLRRVWEALNGLRPSSILGEGRVYGGGLHKLEPNELGNVDAASIVAFIPELQSHTRSTELSLFAQEAAQ
jgi:hypothetical protein